MADDDLAHGPAAGTPSRLSRGWVEKQIDEAYAKGEFENLPGFGKPLAMRDTHDPDWWVKSLMEREQITGVLPPAMALRRERRELPETLDAIPTEAQVREVLRDFNARVRDVTLRPQPGPTVVVGGVDVEELVRQWHRRRRA